MNNAARRLVRLRYFPRHVARVPEGQSARESSGASSRAGRLRRGGLDELLLDIRILVCPGCDCGSSILATGRLDKGDDQQQVLNLSTGTHQALTIRCHCLKLFRPGIPRPGTRKSDRRCRGGMPSHTTCPPPHSRMLDAGKAPCEVGAFFCCVFYRFGMPRKKER